MPAPSIKGSIASLAVWSILTGASTGAPASGTDLNFSTGGPSLFQPDEVSSLAQLPAPTATSSLSGADIHSLGGYSQGATLGDLEPRDPIGGGGGGGGGNGGNGNNGNNGNNNKGHKSGRSKTKFGEEVNAFIPKAKQIISNARADSRSAVKDIIQTLDRLLGEAESMKDKTGDTGNQYVNFKNNIEHLKRKTKNQLPEPEQPISEADAMNIAESAVDDLAAWISPGNPSFKASAWTAAAAAAAAAGLASL